MTTNLTMPEAQALLADCDSITGLYTEDNGIILSTGQVLRLNSDGSGALAEALAAFVAE